MKTKGKRLYNPKGLDFSNLTFISSAEKRYIHDQVKKISNKIKEMRKEQGLSQEEFAEKISVSVATIKFIEQNQRAPSLPMLFKIIYALDKNAKLWM